VGQTVLLLTMDTSQIKNGVGQGCPFSSFLFPISIELLSNYTEKITLLKVYMLMIRRLNKPYMQMMPLFALMVVNNLWKT